MTQTTTPPMGLKGLRVLDLGRFIAGPLTCGLLADQGAEVIRIEPPEGAADRAVMPVGHPDGGALYLQMNRNKRSLTLDTRSPEGRSVFEDLVKSADVVVVNLPRRAIEAMGFGYDTLRAIRPDIIVTTITAYDYASPEGSQIGFDGSGQALSGAMYLTGFGDAPTRASVSYVDFASGLTAAYATTAALLERERTGQGQHVSASLMGTATHMMSMVYIEEHLRARTRQPSGNASPIAAPSNLYRAADGWLMVQVIGADMFARWARLVGREDLLADPRFATDQDRAEHAQVLDAVMADWAALRSLEACLAELAAARLPGCRVNTPAEALAMPSMGHYLQDVPLGAGSVPISLGGIGMAVLSEGAHRAAPALGRDTASILEALGYAPERITTLRQAGVV